MSAMDPRLMQQVIDLASSNVRSGDGGPFAALVVREGVVIASATNRVTSTSDPTAHAEVVAIREACSALGSFQLSGCEMYASCEPCPMCLGAIYWARPDRVYYASTRQDAARAGFDDELIYTEIAAPPRERRIPFVHAPVDDAARPFELWLSSPHVDY